MAVLRSEALTARREKLGVLWRSGSFLTGLGILAFWMVCAFIGPFVVPKDPYRPDAASTLLPPGPEHWFGTDKLGRDVFSRVISGSRDILITAPLATLLAVAVGVALGLLSGYYRGWLDEAFGRVIDALLALPLVVIGMVTITAVGAGKLTLILVIGIFFAPNVARTVRAATLSERELDYVAAAQLRNESGFHIMFVEILRNIWAPILVEFTIRVGWAIFTIATLSFLGLGVPPPAPDWGAQVNDHYALLSGGYWWPVFFPALAIASLVVSINLVAEGVGKALDA